MSSVATIARMVAMRANKILYVMCLIVHRGNFDLDEHIKV